MDGRWLVPLVTFPSALSGNYSLCRGRYHLFCCPCRSWELQLPSQGLTTPPRVYSLPATFAGYGRSQGDPAGPGGAAAGALGAADETQSQKPQLVSNSKVLDTGLQS